MERKYKITIPEPCHEDWNKMTPEETGRFCGVCTKGVVDFTNKSNIEIQEYFIKNQGQKVCGRFKNEQVNKFDVQIPLSVLNQRMPFHKAFLLALFIVMGTTLFSCKNHNDDTLGDVVVIEDTIQANHTTGIILPLKDSIQKENITIGDAKYKPNDTLHSIQPPPPKVDQVKFVKEKKPVPNIVTLGIVAIEPHSTTNDTINNPIDYNAPFALAYLDSKPYPPEGIDKFYTFIKENYVAPNKTENYSGRIFVSFIVEKNGTLTNFKILRDFGMGSGEEVIRILKTAGKWVPGKFNNHIVRSSYALPISFKLTK